MNRNSFLNVLFPVVLCTQDKWRREISIRLIYCLNKIFEEFELSIIIFDNGSIFKDPLLEPSFPHFQVSSPANVGYWTALKWVLDNYQKLYQRNFDYIHPIESDFKLFNFSKLFSALEFLEENNDFSAVRTQEFSVKYKHFFFKQSKIPKFLKRSIVADYNAISEEKVVFESPSIRRSVYSSNWHAKVPALQRMGNFESVFEDLQKLDVVSEKDFMRLMYQRNKKVGVLDGGIWSLTNDNPRANGISGSYSNKQELSLKNYRNTRIDKIDNDYPNPLVQFID